MNGRGQNLFKPRSDFGTWCDNNNISQQWLVNNCGIDKNSASRICNDPDHKPNGSTRGRVITGLNRYGYNVDEEDFW